jgi:hypothetical protein
MMRTVLQTSGHQQWQSDTHLRGRHGRHITKQLLGARVVAWDEVLGSPAGSWQSHTCIQGSSDDIGVTRLAGPG